MYYWRLRCITATEAVVVFCSPGAAWCSFYSTCVATWALGVSGRSVNHQSAGPTAAQLEARTRFCDAVIDPQRSGRLCREQRAAGWFSVAPGHFSRETRPLSSCCLSKKKSRYHHFMDVYKTKMLFILTWSHPVVKNIKTSTLSTAAFLRLWSASPKCEAKLSTIQTGLKIIKDFPGSTWTFHEAFTDPSSAPPPSLLQTEDPSTKIQV